MSSRGCLAFNSARRMKRNGGLTPSKNKTLKLDHALILQPTHFKSRSSLQIALFYLPYLCDALLKQTKQRVQSYPLLLEVNPIVLNGAYFWVDTHRTGLWFFNSVVFSRNNLQDFGSVSGMSPKRCKCKYRLWPKGDIRVETVQSYPSPLRCKPHYRQWGLLPNTWG